VHAGLLRLVIPPQTDTGGSSDETAALFANLGLKPLVEITLVWVLFSDAARIRIQDFRHGLGLYVRLLAVGLPLTVAAEWGLAAWWLLPGLGVWSALLVGAALAPTDAALGLPVVTNPAVPAPIPTPHHRRERPQRWHRDPRGHVRHRRSGGSRP